MEQTVEFRQFNISGPLNTDSAPGGGGGGGALPGVSEFSKKKDT